MPVQPEPPSALRLEGEPAVMSQPGLGPSGQQVWHLRSEVAPIRLLRLAWYPGLGVILDTS
jgi:hypothetical protein